MYVLISGSDINRLDLNSQQIDISAATNVAKIQMLCQKNIKTVTVHDQFWFQLMHHNFTLLTKSLYMFRAPTCPSSGGQTIHTP